MKGKQKSVLAAFDLHSSDKSKEGAHTVDDLHSSDKSKEGAHTVDLISSSGDEDGYKYDKI